MTETEALRHENSILQKRITAQRRELGRLYTEVQVLSGLMNRFARDYWDQRKKIEAEEEAKRRADVSA